MLPFSILPKTFATQKSPHRLPSSVGQACTCFTVTVSGVDRHEGLVIFLAFKVLTGNLRLSGVMPTVLSDLSIAAIIIHKTKPWSSGSSVLSDSICVKVRQSLPTDPVGDIV